MIFGTTLSDAKHSADKALWGVAYNQVKDP